MISTYLLIIITSGSFVVPSFLACRIRALAVKLEASVRLLAGWLAVHGHHHWTHVTLLFANLAIRGDQSSRRELIIIATHDANGRTTFGLAWPPPADRVGCMLIVAVVVVVGCCWLSLLATGHRRSQLDERNSNKRTIHDVMIFIFPYLWPVSNRGHQWKHFATESGRECCLYN